MEKFSMKVHGYDPKEVNAFLDDVIAQFDKMISELKNNREKISTIEKDKEILTEQINRYRALELTMNKTISAAQDSGEQIRRIAKQESDMIITDARNNANRIVGDALLRAEKAEYEAMKLQRNVSLFKKKLRNVIEAQLEMVEDIEKVDFN